MYIEGYKIKDMLCKEDQRENEIVEHLLKVLNDKNINEENKMLYKEQFNELMRVKNITMEPTKVILEKIK